MTSWPRTGGLRPSHVRVIGAVPPGGITITELVQRVGMTKQGCGQFVQHLTATGHLGLERPPADRRRRVVRRSELGRHVLRSVVGRQRARERRWAALVGEDRYAAFRSVLEELTRPGA